MAKIHKKRKNKKIIFRKKILRKNLIDSRWSYNYSTGYFGKQFRAYHKEIFFEEPDKLNFYYRADHRNYKMWRVTAALKKGMPRLLFLKHFYRRDLELRRNQKEDFFWIKPYASSFNNCSLFLYKHKRLLQYQKRTPGKYFERFVPKFSWSSPIYSEEVSKLKKMYMDFRRRLYEKNLRRLAFSKQGKKIGFLIKQKKFPSPYMFSFFANPGILETEVRHKYSFFQNYSKLGNRESFVWQIKRDNTLRYRPLRARRYMLTSTSKIWKRVFEKQTRKYLGNKSIGDMRYLAKKNKADLFSKNSSGSKMREDSQIGYNILSILQKLKIAPSHYIANKFISSGLVTVNEKVFNNPNARVQVYDTIRYKGSLFRNYLLTVMHQEDRFFEKFPTKVVEKHSYLYMRRYWPPSFLEISFKLQEAVILRNSFAYEQNIPYLIRKSNIPAFLKTRFEKKGAGLF